MTSKDPEFKGFDNQKLITKRWGAETVVYATLSGETHLLDNQSAELLAQINQSPISYSNLRGILAENFDTTEKGVDQEIDEYLEYTLKQFIQLGLIEPIETRD